MTPGPKGWTCPGNCPVPVIVKRTGMTGCCKQHNSNHQLLLVEIKDNQWHRNFGADLLSECHQRRRYEIEPTIDH